MQLSHLLMIEDDARLAVMVGEYLERSGYSFEHAAEGGEGLRRVQQRLPDLVILDLLLPGADGLELCRQLRALPGAAGRLLVGYPRLVRRLLRNLLENAKRHTASPSAEPVVCRIGTGDRQAGRMRWQVEVCDRGPGVPDAFKSRIFEPFFRLPGSSERDGGVGLGLARVRAIARRHGGEVTSRDRTGGGAVFEVSLQSVVA